ncbi:hypothetical protein ma226 [Moumouvirus australiensis]|uniref:Uncharacterized protein n=1 Tax=Moumouvirus australiensis TaxID=2109587 RepID=A0A2P1EL38_9VIRU|nr:hypothetical protein QKC55_gp678 [Moumouvirus australiensis]AVL94612.1 hypothetical protein ma226 [Moumouvirus australiensis]QGR53755.1 hypothetical protein [Moumouvirus maliensis]
MLNFKKFCCEKIDDCCCQPCMNDCLAREIECLWKQEFCDSTLLKPSGIPSCSGGVMVLTHSLGNCMPKIKLNGLTSKSILANNAFYSAEVSCCKWLNLYQIQLPDIPGDDGCKSSGEIYTEALIKFGISVDGDSYNWKGACPNTLSINSKAINMHPIEFSKKQIAAVKAVIDYFSCSC